MARPLRLHIPGAMYHVTLRGNHRQDIFFAPSDRDLMNALFADVLERCDARLHAYCYMTNHIHAVIQVSDIPLGRVMMRLAGTYARTVQARFETTGHLFEKRYHPVLVDADTYLLELLRYLHLNPVTAGLVTSPDDYTWSSHHAYMGFRDEPWVTTTSRAEPWVPIGSRARANRSTTSSSKRANASWSQSLCSSRTAARMCWWRPGLGLPSRRLQSRLRR
jgi:putative transposase